MAETAYGTCAMAILISMFSLWGVNPRVNDPTFIDAFWGIGFAIQAILCIPHARFSLHSMLMAAIVTIWGFRQGRYLYGHWRKYGQDRRYTQLLKRLGGNPKMTTLYIFLAQGLAMWIVGLPIQYAASKRARLTVSHLVGAVIAIAGMLTESLADWQMAKFLAKESNKGKVMDQGLWRYSRHPNFFGSSTFWWGIYLFAAPSIMSWPIISPVYMTFLLLAVTGIPPIELQNRNNPEYQAYKRRTHMFIPWFPKTAHGRPNVHASSSHAAPSETHTTHGDEDNDTRINSDSVDSGFSKSSSIRDRDTGFQSGDRGSSSAYAGLTGSESSKFNETSSLRERRGLITESGL
jgi:steroid 5-alpha reductase family enzyme